MRPTRFLRNVLLCVCCGVLSFNLGPWGCSKPVVSGEPGQERAGLDGTVAEKAAEKAAEKVVDKAAEPVQDKASEKVTPKEQVEEPVKEVVKEPGVPDAGGKEEPRKAEQNPDLPLLEKVVESQGEGGVKDSVPPKACQTDADCGKRTCAQAGKICKRNTPICRTGFCVDLKVDIPDTTCEPVSGSCQAPKPVCKDTCDCIQGLMCVGASGGTEGTCIAPFVPVYCCDNSGCPSGKACVHRGGAPGVCP